ncbi:MAG TPA: LysR substrate-binding domain-containing protein [Bradyrhizobium sp.]|nr:LysR substrate-binding domain-containing protein [Bradyrhizobium sp.]
MAIVARRIGSARRVVCASPDYLLSRGRPETPQDIAAHDCVTFTGFTHAESWEFHVGSSPASNPIRSRLQVDAAEAVVEAALAGTGIIRLFSYHVAAAVKTAGCRCYCKNSNRRRYPSTSSIPAAACCR